MGLSENIYIYPKQNESQEIYVDAYQFHVGYEKLLRVYIMREVYALAKLYLKIFIRFS